MKRTWLWILGILLLLSMGLRGQAQTRGLDIYFIDTEGGAATLIVTPAGESTLIDDGNPGSRDAERIARVAKIAGLKALDNLVCTHWHLDHYGGTEHLAKLLPIHHFYDRGILAQTLDDPDHYPTLIAAWKAASKGQSTALKPGDDVKLAQGDGPPVRLLTLCSGGEVMPDSPGDAENPIAKDHKPMAADPSDNARSLGFLLSFGGFRFLDLGDLTWNIEYKLVAPTNKIGLIDVYQSTHHGLEISNNPVVIKSVRPTVAIFNNGPKKGGHPDVIATLRSLPTIQHRDERDPNKTFFAIYQMHKNLTAPSGVNAPNEFIANMEDSDKCKGDGYIKLSVAPDSKSYTVMVSSSRAKPVRYETRMQK